MDKALARYESIQDTAGMVAAMEDRRDLYLSGGDLEAYLKSCEHLLGLYTILGDSTNIGWELANISLALTNLGHGSEALGYMRRSWRIFEQMGDSTELAFSCIELGRAHRAMGNLDSAFHYAELEVRFMQRRGLGMDLCRAFYHRAEVWEQMHAVDSALADLRRSTACTDTSTLLAASYAAMARLELAAGLLGQAEGHGTTALAMARATGNIQRLHAAASVLASIYVDRGRFQEALEMRTLEMRMGDSLRSDALLRSVDRLSFLQRIYADSLRNADERYSIIRDRDAQLSRERERRNVLLYSAFGLLMITGLVWRQRNKVNKARKRSDELLLNILPSEVAEELKAKGEAEARQIDQVTVLFTDFKGFTAMSEKVTPKELVHDLHECFSAFDHIMAKHGIEKIKTIGDAYMAAGGLPTPNTTHALDVVRAAFEMRDFIAEGKARKISAGLPFFEIRIGVHTGPVVAGIVGVKKFSYDIWGDTVNIASRMESSGEVGQVNISESTYALVKDKPGFTFKARGRVQAKGKGEMEMYFVHRSSSAG
ncbi:MAG: hypothetical protein IPH53_00785 [Flavobacteriales bacterium]|nr:hypothetical protein [Flavobacteriales bacterium]